MVLSKAAGIYIYKASIFILVVFNVKQLRFMLDNHCSYINRPKIDKG